MQREEKQLDLSIEAIVTRLNELKNQLQAILQKIENESDTLTWPTVLDNFALISAQFSAISKMLSIDKMPPLRNLTVLPLKLSQDRDEELCQLTEQRIPVFSHDLVPDYLRTKPEPDIEMKIHQFLNKANGIAFETAQKQSSAFNKVLNHVLDTINKSREDWESDPTLRSSAATTNNSDTQTLVSVISLGKGLKQMVPQGVPSGPAGMMVPPGIRPGGAGPNSSTPAGIKTNIKPASQLHSYR